MNLRLVHFGLFVAASLAALANYEGLAMTIRAETVWQHFFCAAIALGVFSSIAVFWHVAYHVVPSMRDGELRLAALAATVVGALAIIGMSAWWTVAALGGGAAQKCRLSRSRRPGGEIPGREPRRSWRVSGADPEPRRLEFGYRRFGRL